MSDQVENKTAESETTDSKSIIITKSIKSLTSPEKTASIDNNQENTEKTPKALTEAEKLELRIKKFGVQSENAKLTLRAERFGTANSTSSSASTTPDPNKLEKRAQRFGISAPSSPANGNNGISAEVLEKRAKRFGINNESNSTASSTVSDEVLSKRKERFGIVDEDSKKKLRSERFANKV